MPWSLLFQPCPEAMHFIAQKTAVPHEANRLEVIWRVFRADTWMSVRHKPVVTSTSIFRTKLGVLVHIHNKFATDIFSSPACAYNINE
jgi:hypothetical protein